MKVYYSFGINLVYLSKFCISELFFSRGALEFSQFNVYLEFLEGIGCANFVAILLISFSTSWKTGFVIVICHVVGSRS